MEEINGEIKYININIKPTKKNGQLQNLNLLDDSFDKEEEKDSKKNIQNENRT